MADTKVLYNAECPVCRFEIHHYRVYAQASGLPLKFEDLNDTELSTWGLDQDKAARRLYVLDAGEMTSGIDAFLVLWRKMPRYRWLARLVGLPGIRQVASLAYDWILAPVIYRWHLRRIRKKG